MTTALTSSLSPRTTPRSSEWVCQVTNAFQSVVLAILDPKSDASKFAEECRRIPAPQSAFERLLLRSLTDDCLIALLTRARLLQSPWLLDRVVSVITAIHRDERPFGDLIEVLPHVRLGLLHGSLADTIGARLESELPRHLTAGAIAAEYQLRRAALDSLFHERFGVGFHAYLRATRVRRGLDLVLGGMKVEAAALSVGYRSKKDFYRAVRQETGSTPGQLRHSASTPPDVKTELPAKQGTLFDLT